MSIKYIDELTFDIYIKNNFIENIDFENKEDIEKYLKKIFKTLNQKYKIIIEGFYNITIYIDKYYGIVIHLEKEELEYYEYYKNQVDMRLITVHTDFTYLVNDIPKSIINKINIKTKDNNIYIKLIDKLNDLEMMRLMEFSEIVYNYNI